MDATDGLPGAGAAPEAAAEVELCHPLEGTGWDRALPEDDRAGIFHSQEWARVLHVAYQYRPFYLAARQRGPCRGMLPLMEVRSRWTGTRGVSLPFSDEVPILHGSDQEREALVAASLALGRQRRWRYLEWRDAEPPTPGATPWATYWGHRVDLGSDESHLRSRLAPSVRRAVRRAQEAGVKVEFSRRWSDLQHYYRLHCQTRRRQGVPPQPLAFFRALQKHVLESGLGEVALARHDHAIVSGAVFLTFRDQALYKFGATDLRWQALRGSNLLFWTAIKRFANQGFKVFCLGRTDVGQEGLRRFKRSFGAKERPMAYYRMDVQTESYLRRNAAVGGQSSRVFQILPEWAGRLAGRMGYRHLG